MCDVGGDIKMKLFGIGGMRRVEAEMQLGPITIKLDLY